MFFIFTEFSAAFHSELIIVIPFAPAFRRGVLVGKPRTLSASDFCFGADEVSRDIIIITVFVSFQFSVLIQLILVGIVYTSNVVKTAALRVIAAVIAMIFFKSFLRCSILLKSLESIIRVTFVTVADLLVYKPISVREYAVSVNFICSRMLTIPALYEIIICC